MDLLDWVQRRATKMLRGLEHLSYEDRVESWACSSLALGRPHCSLTVPKGAHRKAEEGPFTMACMDKTMVNGFKMAALD